MELDANLNFINDDGSIIEPKTAIRLIRREQGWSTKDMGDILGVSRRTIENWEQGIRKPSNPVRILLKRYL